MEPKKKSFSRQTDWKNGLDILQNDSQKHLNYSIKSWYLVHSRQRNTSQNKRADLCPKEGEKRYPALRRWRGNSPALSTASQTNSSSDAPGLCFHSWCASYLFAHLQWVYKWFWSTSDLPVLFVLRRLLPWIDRKSDLSVFLSRSPSGCCHRSLAVWVPFFFFIIIIIFFKPLPHSHEALTVSKCL